MKSLKAREHNLASTEFQLKFLNNGIFKSGRFQPFEQHLQHLNRWPLKPVELEIFQINLGYMCNQTCKHCHVDAGPDRKEIMSKDVMQQCVDIIGSHPIKTVDLTGGAPEMHPHFRWFVEELRKTEVEEIIVRSNLTIIMSNPRFYGLPAFFRENQVRVVSSLPYYKRLKTDRQRGNGVFDKSIEALVLLNKEGYGKENRHLQLDLVYNPSGAFLPGNQQELELEFKKSLMQDFGISFNQLFTITNLPISRFLEYLVASENYEEYMEKLIESFNPMALDGLMCRNTLSVDWQGFLYDCDFNQMLEMKVEKRVGQHISEFNLTALNSRNILTNQHCFGCTAGAGSSCQGATV